MRPFSKSGSTGMPATERIFNSSILVDRKKIPV
jgi:hypothetical protein